MKNDDARIYKDAAERGGWSKTGRADTSATWGDIYDILADTLHGSERVLDVGTAEGKRLLRIAASFQSAVGVDIEPEFIRLAQEYAAASGITNIAFVVGDAQSMPLPPESFDWVVCRHAPLHFPELSRLLRRGGKVLTQQVHGGDKENLKRIFGRGQGYGEDPDALLDRYAREALAAGFTVTRREVSDLPYVFRDEAELRRFLTNTPTVTAYGRPGDEELLLAFLAQTGANAISSNTSRFLLELERA